MKRLPRCLRHMGDRLLLRAHGLRHIFARMNCGVAPVEPYAPRAAPHLRTSQTQTHAERSEEIGTNGVVPPAAGCLIHPPHSADQRIQKEDADACLLLLFGEQLQGVAASCAHAAPTWQRHQQRSCTHAPCRNATHFEDFSPRVVATPHLRAHGSHNTSSRAGIAAQSTNKCGVAPC